MEADGAQLDITAHADGAQLESTAQKLAAKLYRPQEHVRFRLSAPVQSWNALRASAGSIGSPDDAELREALDRVLAALGEVKRLTTPGRIDDSKRREALDRIALALTLAQSKNLGRDAAIEIADTLDRALLGIGDREYLFNELQREWFMRQEPGAQAWSALYGDATPSLLRQIREGERATPESVRQARYWLLALRWTRSSRDRQRRARLLAKRRVLRMLGTVVWTLVILTTVTSGILGNDTVQDGMELPPTYWAELTLAVVAGALGSAVSGTYKLRDEIQRGLAVREFRATIFAQLAVGAAAGLFVELVLESRLVSIANVRASTEWAVHGAAAFVAGFSEALFLGVVRRIGGSVDAKPRNG